ncbi:MAG: hypothetical protein QOH79_2952 [Acidimicrobiaceae bacterium]
MPSKILDQLPRRNAVIVVAVAAVALLVAIVALWSKGESGSTSAFCTSVRTGENPLDVFDRYDTTNVVAARGELQRGIERLRQLESAAPGEIRGDMQVLVDVAQQLVAALDPATKDKTADFTSEFDRVRSASANVTRFASDKCAVQLESATSSAPATLPPGTPSTPP